MLYRTIAAHLPTFLARTAGEDGTGGWPVFVRREFEAYLRCGILNHGLLRARCERCGETRVVAFSCRGRGFCPSCGGRRMSELAAHLVDRVLPRVPIRQWVFTVPVPVRYQLAFDAGLTRAVLRVCLAPCLAGSGGARPGAAWSRLAAGASPRFSGLVGRSTPMSTSTR